MFLMLLINSMGAWADSTLKVVVGSGGSVTQVKIASNVVALDANGETTGSYYNNQVRLTIVPNTGKYVSSVKYKQSDETDDHDASYSSANDDYHFYMPNSDGINVTVTVTFGDAVASIGTHNYGTLKDAFGAVESGETITMIANSDESGVNHDFSGATRNITIDLNGHTVSFGNISNKYGDLIITDKTTNHNGELNFGTFGNQGNVTFKDVTVNCNAIDNAGGSDNKLTFDNATIVCATGIQWMNANSDFVLKNGASVEVHGNIFIAYDADADFTIEDNASTMKMIGSHFSGYVDISAKIKPYVRPDLQASFAFNTEYGTIANPFILRKTWGLELVSNLTNAAVTFYKSNAVPTVAFIDSPGSVANLADAGDYIIMHIVPNDGYWTNLQLLMAMETGASLAPQMRAPGLELGQVPTLLKADEGYSNGAGWYYYQIPAGHSVNAGYVTSTIDGFVAPKFDLSTATVDANDAKTYHVSNGDWNTTISIDKNSFTYNGSAQGPQLSGTTMQIKKGNDDACTLPLIGNVTLSSTATNASATAYDATLSSVANGCFTSTKAIPFTIGKKALTVTAKAKTITYGDAPANDGVTYTGFADGENENTDGIFGTSTLSYAYSYAQYGNVGDAYTITPSGLTATNYDITFNTGTLTVNQKEVGLNWGTTSLTYNGSAQAPACEATGLVNNDVINVTVTGAQTATGNYTATATALTGDKTGNYKMPAANTKDFTINPKRVNDSNTADDKDTDIIIEQNGSATVSASYTYNGSGQKPTITVKDGTTVIPEGEYTISYKDANGNAVTDPTNVGTYTVVITDNDGGNYNVSGTTTFVINQKALTITADNASKVYDGTALTKNSYTNTALATGDAITSVTITGSQTNVGTSNNVPSAAVIKKGNVDVTANYNITYVNGTLEVTKKTVKDNPADGEGTVSIVLTDISVDGFTYNGNGQKPTITVKDGTNADAQVIPANEYTVTIKDANGNAVTDPTNVGTYTVVITDNDGGNYNVSGTTTFVINQKALTITADNASKVYDGTALTKNSYTNTALATGDAITSVTITGSQTNVGTSNNVPSAAVIKKGNVDVTANYNITYVNGTLEVTKKTVKDNPADGEGTVSIVLTDISVDGFTYNGNGQKPTITVKDGTNADAQVIPANEYTITIKDSKGNTVTDPKDAGTYTVVITDNDGGNYDVSGETTFTINKKTLTITANDQEKAAGSDDPTLTYTQDGLVAGDAITGALTRATGEAVGTYAITLGTLSAGNNYTINFTEATLTIYRDLQMAEMFSGTNEWASMIAQEDLAVPAGMAAYIVTGVSGNNIITKEISYIPAGVPIILQKKDNNASGKATAGTGTDDVSENLLKGSATEASTIQPYKDYVLYNGRFELAGISSVPAGKVYLPATALNGTTAPQFLVIGETTSLGSMHNSQCIMHNDGWYTLDGRKLDKTPTTKGIYVNGGRKVVVK